MNPDTLPPPPADDTQPMLAVSDHTLEGVAPPPSSFDVDLIEVGEDESGG